MSDVYIDVGGLELLLGEMPFVALEAPGSMEGVEGDWTEIGTRTSSYCESDW